MKATAKVNDREHKNDQSSPQSLQKSIEVNSDVDSLGYGSDGDTLTPTRSETMDSHDFQLDLYAKIRESLDVSPQESLQLWEVNTVDDVSKWSSEHQKNALATLKKVVQDAATQIAQYHDKNIKDQGDKVQPVVSDPRNSLSDNDNMNKSLRSDIVALQEKVNTMDQYLWTKDQLETFADVTSNFYREMPFMTYQIQFLQFEVTKLQERLRDFEYNDDVHSQNMTDQHVKDIEKLLASLQENVIKLATEKTNQLQTYQEDLTSLKTNLEARDAKIVSLQSQLTSLQNQTANKLPVLKLRPSNDSSPASGISGTTHHKSYNLADPQEFTGEDQRAFKEWKCLMNNKLRANHDHFHNNVARQRYIISRLSGEALRYTEESFGFNDNPYVLDTADLMDFLDSEFGMY